MTWRNGGQSCSKAVIVVAFCFAAAAAADAQDVVVPDGFAALGRLRVVGLGRFIVICTN